MVSRLAPLFQNLNVAAGLLGDRGEHLLEVLLGDQAGTAAGHEDASRFEDIQCQAVQAEIAFESLLDAAAVPGHLRGIQDDGIKLLPLLFELFEDSVGFARLKTNAVADGIQFRVRSRLINGGLGGVEGLHGLRLTIDDGVEGERAGVAVHFQHVMIFEIAGGCQAVVALVEVEPGLLSGDHIHAVADAVLFEEEVRRRSVSVEQLIGNFQAFGFADSLLCAEPDPFAGETVFEEANDEILFLRECQTRELDKEPGAVAIDGETGELIGFAEDESAAGGLEVVEQSDLLAEGDRLVEPLDPEFIVEGLCFVPGIEPHANVAVGVEQAPGDELAAVGLQEDFVARLGIAFDA